MKISIPKETSPGEKRVAIVPETLRRFVQKKWEVVFEKGAGVAAGFSDEDYVQAGAVLTEAPCASGWIFRVQFQEGDVSLLGEGSTLVSLLFPLSNPSLVRKLAERKVTAWALDLLPRTSLAQAMDVLSSQANLAGYRAVVHAAALLPKFFPMMMTAAGTIRPARVLVLGAGVAGLQAVATAKRLGAVVEVFDVRPAVKEEVESLGARFIAVDEKESGEGEGGYAKETSKEYRQKQKELVAKHLAQADVCITTALIPGRRAPVLITKEMAMPKGSVMVDLAAAQGGNCEWTEPGKEIVREGVLIVGETNWPARMPSQASTLFSRNMEKFLFHIDSNPDDLITQACRILVNGEVVHPKVKEALA